MKRSLLITTLALLLFFVAADRALGAPLGNDDITKMLAAGLSEATVLRAIDSADTAAFDTTATALIKLKRAGVSDAVIQRILTRRPEKQRPSSSSNDSAARSPNMDGVCVIEGSSSEILHMRASNKLVQLPYQVINIDMKDNALAAVLTFGIVSLKSNSQVRLDGARANVRITDKAPVFLDMMFPVGRRDVEKMFYLMRLEAQANARTVEMTRTEGGLWGAVVATDIARSTRVPVISELIAEQCKLDGKPYAHYRVRPQTQLALGEYAYIQPAADGSSAAVFEFGVDN